MHFFYRLVSTGLPLTNFNARGVVIHIDQPPTKDVNGFEPLEGTDLEVKQTLCRLLDRLLTEDEDYGNTVVLNEGDYLRNSTAWASILVAFPMLASSAKNLYERPQDKFVADVVQTIGGQERRRPPF